VRYNRYLPDLAEIERQQKAGVYTSGMLTQGSHARPPCCPLAARLLSTQADDSTPLPIPSFCMI
jgi:hypothetical protein